MDLLAILSAAWRNKWLVCSCALVLGSLGAAYGLLAKQWYRAETVLLPTDTKVGGGLNAQLSQLTSLAGLAGLGGGGGDKTEPLGVLRSREFSKAFISERKLLPELFADRWDGAKRTWANGPDSPPDIREAVKFFQEHVLQIDENRRTGLVTVAIEWTNAEQAADWANDMVRRLNEQMRQRALHDATANVEYLQSQVESTGELALRQAASRVLESEMEKLMLARGRSEYSFRVIDVAEPPMRRIRPHRLIIVILCGLAGSAFGIALASIREASASRG